MDEEISIKIHSEGDKIFMTAMRGSEQVGKLEAAVEHGELKLVHSKITELRAVQISGFATQTSISAAFNHLLRQYAEEYDFRIAPPKTRKSSSTRPQIKRR